MKLLFCGKLVSCMDYNQIKQAAGLSFLFFSLNATCVVDFQMAWN